MSNEPEWMMFQENFTGRRLYRHAIALEFVARIRPSGSAPLRHDAYFKRPHRNVRHKGGFEGRLLHIMGFGNDNPQIPTVTKMMTIENKTQLRQQLFDWPEDTTSKRILVSPWRAN